MRAVVLGLGLMLIASGCRAQHDLAEDGGSTAYVGDYDAEPRDGGHVDCALLVRRLQELGANTYMWLIWHSPNDWEDLHEFLPLAAAAGITVWVYLVPPSETSAVHPELGFPYSEPFRLDYVRWAEEIAKLSLEHENLVGYVIDDFWGNVNPHWFTPESIRAMVDAGRAINPRIKFYPLMYFNQIGPRFVNMLGTVVDGVVAAYPPSPAAIEHALSWLNGEATAPPEGSVVYPWDTSSRAGDFGFLQQTVKVVNADNASISFRFKDDFGGPTESYHFMQARIDDKVVWEEDVAGADAGEVTVDVSDQVAGKGEVTLSLGIFDRQGVSNFGVTATFTDLRAQGLELADMANVHAWTESVRGSFTTAASPPWTPEVPIHLPLILMPAAQAREYEHRHGEPGTPERVAAMYEMCLRFVREGQAQGVVSYCLDKSEGSASFDAVAAVIAAFWRDLEEGTED